MNRVMNKAEACSVPLVGLTAALAGLVFALDLLIPLGVSVAVLYVALVLLTLWCPQRRFTLIAALASTILTILGGYFSPPGGTLWMAIANRALTLFVIGVTAFLVLRYKRSQQEIKTLRGLLPICASCKKIRNDKGYWNHLEIFIEEHADVEFSHGLCDACMAKWYPELNPELAERDPPIAPEQK